MAALLPWLLAGGHPDTVYGLITAPAFYGPLLVYMAVNTAVAVAFLIWLWRIASNVPALGIGRLRWAKGWTIGGWFIPFANLVIPFLVMADLWRASDPDAPAQQPVDFWVGRSCGAAFYAWWATWIGGNMIWSVAMQAVKSNPDVKATPGETFADVMHKAFDVPLASWFWLTSVTGLTLLIISSGFAIRFVLALTARQLERLDRHGDQTPAAPAWMSPGALTPPPVPQVTVPAFAPTIERDGQIEEGVEGGFWIRIGGSGEGIIEVTSVDGTALQIEVANQAQRFFAVPHLAEPAYATTVPLDGVSQLFVRVIDPTGGERSWHLRAWLPAGSHAL